jgi:hypothetical protein
VASSPDAVLYQYVDIGVGGDAVIVGRIYGYSGPRFEVTLYEYVDVGFERALASQAVLYEYVDVT